MECLIHSLAFNCVKMAWVAGVGGTDSATGRDAATPRADCRCLPARERGRAADCPRRLPGGAIGFATACGLGFMFYSLQFFRVFKVLSKVLNMLKGFRSAVFKVRVSAFNTVVIWE